MASSKVMTSRSHPNTDLPRQSSSNHPAHSRGFGSMNMEEILRNIHSDSDAFASETNGGGGPNTVEGGIGMGNEAMTLEDYFSKADAMADEDVRVPAVVPMAPPEPTAGAYGMDTVMVNHVTGVPAVQFGSAALELGNGVVGLRDGSGRGKKRAAVEEAPVDKATQQKQRRMIKNRESAARSRDRKQAYTVELESLVTQLEEENARLLREEEQSIKERYKQSPGLEEQKLHTKAEMLELEKQRLGWTKLSELEDRDLEKRLGNGYLKIDNGIRG